MAAEEDIDNIAIKNKTKILEQYHSALEHTFLWTVDSENAHLVESFMIECGWAAFNTIKIVPLGRYQNLIEACKRLDASS